MNEFQKHINAFISKKNKEESYNKLKQNIINFLDSGYDQEEIIAIYEGVFLQFPEFTISESLLDLWISRIFEELDK